MFEKNGKFYADWRNGKGSRLRKSFTSKRAALVFEAEQKQLSHRERKKRAKHPPLRLVLTTAPTPEEATRLARTLVEEHLAACASLIPAVQSIYHWQGQIESSTETLLLLKTAPAQLPALETRLHQLHSYQTPEFLVLAPESVSRPYLDWLQSSLRQP
ncbi:MAG: divalent-cation tolerance protein CutA [Terracidiphilus sp.]|nr:divalent-cation tolerance protein CutA [Terracidiphilus sp.]